MATMKTLNGYGFNATEFDGKTASDYLLKTGTAADSAKLGGKSPEYYLQPRNLLDNSDFTNPVNQRGKSSYTPSTTHYTYTIDRWLIESDESDQIVTVNTDGTITFAHTGRNGSNLQFEQKLEFPIPNGSYATVAVYVTNITGSASLSYSMIDPPYTIFADCEIQSGINVASGKVTADGDCKVRILLDPNSSVTMKWIALYEGSYTANTLPPYVPKGYAAELAECQRYYQIIRLHRHLSTIYDNRYRYYGCSLPVRMRTKPAVTIITMDEFKANSFDKNTLTSYRGESYKSFEGMCVEFICESEFGTVLSQCYVTTKIACTADL